MHVRRDEVVQATPNGTLAFFAAPRYGRRQGVVSHRQKNRKLFCFPGPVGFGRWNGIRQNNIIQSEVSPWK